MRFHFQFLQMRQEGTMDAAAEVLFELHDADAAEGIFIGKWNKAAVVSAFNRHFWHYRHAGTSRHHRQKR